MRDRHHVRLGAALVAAAVLSACGSTPAPQAVSDEAALERVAEWLRMFVEAPTRAGPMTLVTEPLLEPVVLGEVVEVEPGVGQKEGDGDPAVGDNWVVTTFDDDEAALRTYHLTVRVDELISGTVDGEEISVGLVLDGDLAEDEVRAGLLAIGPALWFLAERSPVYAYDPSLYAVVIDGAGVVRVDDADQLSTPFLGEKALKRWTTLDDVRAAYAAADG